MRCSRWRLGGTVLLGAALIGCGQKGPLYLPDKPRAVIPPQETSAPPATPAAAAGPEEYKKKPAPAPAPAPAAP